MEDQTPKFIFKPGQTVRLIGGLQTMRVDKYDQMEIREKLPKAFSMKLGSAIGHKYTGNVWCTWVDSSNFLQRELFSESDLEEVSA